MYTLIDAYREGLNQAPSGPLAELIHRVKMAIQGKEVNPQEFLRKQEMQTKVNDCVSFEDIQSALGGLKLDTAKMARCETVLRNLIAEVLTNEYYQAEWAAGYIVSELGKKLRLDIDVSPDSPIRQNIQTLIEKISPGISPAQ